MTPANSYKSRSRVAKSRNPVPQSPRVVFGEDVGRSGVMVDIDGLVALDDDATGACIRIGLDMAEECAAQARCRYDGGATFDLPWAAGDFSAADSFHLSRAAKRKFRFVFGSERSNVATPLKRPRAGTLYPRTPPRPKRRH